PAISCRSRFSARLATRSFGDILRQHPIEFAARVRRIWRPHACSIRCDCQRAVRPPARKPDPQGETMDERTTADSPESDLAPGSAMELPNGIDALAHVVPSAIPPELFDDKRPGARPAFAREDFSVSTPDPGLSPVRPAVRKILAAKPASVPQMPAVNTAPHVP